MHKHAVFIFFRNIISFKIATFKKYFIFIHSVIFQYVFNVKRLNVIECSNLPQYS